MLPCVSAIFACSKVPRCSGCTQAAQQSLLPQAAVCGGIGWLPELLPRRRDDVQGSAHLLVSELCQHRAGTLASKAPPLATPAGWGENRPEPPALGICGLATDHHAQHDIQHFRATRWAGLHGHSQGKPPAPGHSCLELIPQRTQDGFFAELCCPQGQHRCVLFAQRCRYNLVCSAGRGLGLPGRYCAWLCNSVWRAPF